jgi:hypothetical protein
VTFGAEARLCAQTAPNGCANGACVGTPPNSAAAPPLCVAQKGTLPCPAEFSVAHSPGDGGTPYSAGVVDGRTCTCSCGAPAGVACSSVANLYGTASCGGTPQAVVDADATACASLTGVVAANSTWSADGGACTAYGGPMGGVSPGPAYTLCCTR